MEMYITNPLNGDKAKVTREGLLRTYSVTESIVENAAENGNSYNINTGSINLTGNATKSAVLYLKNNGSSDLHIATVGFLLGNSSGGTGDLLLEVVRNPTAGTIVSGAADVDINVNKNSGSSATLTVDAYKGAESLTLTGGQSWYYSLLAGSARPYAISTGTLVLTPGSSIGINITTQASNTSMDVQVFLSLIEYTL
jgi:hypothetical protein